MFMLVSFCESIQCSKRVCPWNPTRILLRPYRYLLIPSRTFTEPKQPLTTFGTISSRPIYQEAYDTLQKIKDAPHLVATGQIKLLPSYPAFYSTSAAGERGMERGRRTCASRTTWSASTPCARTVENCPRIEELLKDRLNALADKFRAHTVDLQAAPRTIMPPLFTDRGDRRKVGQRSPFSQGSRPSSSLLPLY
jgi:hypothetical protein